MNARRLMINADAEEARPRPFINTGGPLDMITGKFVPAADGSWILSGGLGATTAIVAEANRFKSTLLHGCAINALARWPESEYLNNDTEYAAVDKDRLANMSDLYLDDPVKRIPHIEDLKERISIFDPTTPQGESLDAFVDHIKGVTEEKIKRYKDYEVETEVLDPETMKPMRMLLPTFGAIDSWSESMVRQMNVKNDSFDANTEMKEQRTMHMEEGWQKARLLRQIPSICAKGGIYLLMTGHMGKKIAIGTTPNKKDMAFMGQDEAVKGMSNKFYFLMSSMIKISNTAPLTDKSDRRLSEYPSADGIAGTELQQLQLTLVRCKNAASGNQTQLVSSQKFGLLTGLSYYDYLRNNKYHGLGSPNKVRSPFLGDLNIGRTKIFDAVNDYKVRRALEITYQHSVIQSSWTLMGQPVDCSIPIEVLAEKLMTSNSYAVDDILNSRGWWTYRGAKVDREYLSFFDILSIIENKYRPKWFAVTAG
jgi:hypothetical protein